MKNVPYASAVGSIMYAVRCTRPDVAFAQNMTSRFQQNPGEPHWTAVKNILKYLRNTKDMFLVYGGNPSTELRVECYCDAGFETDRDDTKSQTGYVFVLNGGAVDWKSSKQSTTAMSATESEYIAASEAAMEAVWIRKFISGLGIVPTINEPLNMYCDNSAAVHYANEPGVQKGARHYQRRYHYVRECVELGEIRILKVHTDNNLADPFTKALSNRKLTQHARGMGLRPASSFIYVDKTKTIDCNDQGAEFVHAKVNIKLQDILAPDVDAKFVDEFIPTKKFAVEQFTDPLLVVQVTMFKCGVVATSVSSMHKVVGASTLCTFLNEWAAMDREEYKNEVASESEISLMKANAMANGNTNTLHLSKVQLVSSIICKAITVVDKATNNNPSDSILIQPINLRGKFWIVIPNTSFGNLIAFCATDPLIVETTEELTDHLTHNVKKIFINEFSKVNHCSEEGEPMVLNSVTLKAVNISESTTMILLTSSCKFPFYEADFGFEKTTWTAPASLAIKN
ncbi:retrotransposon protein, putative, ty1-copia subclass [Tanacetum coccineum]